MEWDGSTYNEWNVCGEERVCDTLNYNFCIGNGYGAVIMCNGN